MCKLKFVVMVVLFFICSVHVNAAERFNITCFDNIYHLTIPYTGSNHIKFLLSEDLQTNKTIHKKMKSIFTVNTGFFDPQNEKTISYIYTDGILTECPLTNENILNNSFLMSNWDKISNRAEFRVLMQDGKVVYQICNHNDLIDGDLITSAQGGPILLPNMDLEGECFIVKDDNGKIIRESASVLHKTARTLIGLKDQDVHIFVVTDKHPLTIFECQELCSEYMLDSAMAFDGGSSTSFDYKNIHIISTGIRGDNTGRKLKSFLIFK